MASLLRTGFALFSGTIPGLKYDAPMTSGKTLTFWMTGIHYSYVIDLGKTGASNSRGPPHRRSSGAWLSESGWFIYHVDVMNGTDYRCW